MHAYHFKAHVCYPVSNPDLALQLDGNELECQVCTPNWVTKERGVITNVPEVLHQLRYETRREIKRDSSCVNVEPEYEGESFLTGVGKSLARSGHAYGKYHSDQEWQPSRQDQRLATSLRIWLTEDTLASVDLANHYYLSEHYPVAGRRRRPRDGDLAEEPIARRARAAVDAVEAEDPAVIINPGSALLEPAVGEDLDDELENIANEDQDRQEPTDNQKRELLKIHRGLGHPQPNELGRALRNAGVKRHLIR